VCYICYRLPAGEHQQGLGARAGQLKATLVRVTSVLDLGFWTEQGVRHYGYKSQGTQG
jgi:hypothetical protein